jgi:hypothetical protein
MNKLDYGIIGLTLLMGLVLLTFVTYEAYGIKYIDIPAWAEGGYEWDIICELTNLKPFYDCPEFMDDFFDASGRAWIVVQVNSTVFQDLTGTSVYGYAVHTKSPFGHLSDSDFSVCNRFPDVNQTIYEGKDLCTFNYIVFGEAQPQTCYSPYPCMTVLEHELKHLKCNCNWHEGLYGKAAPIMIGVL